ncbi:hypothetical protein AQZ50_17260 [Novosphingobium sp. Fuku2-ISO-50]|nr:hypothetical protein AQZ50_17260 [Novosphingobium sp. Fuku2-ISO-50]
MIGNLTDLSRLPGMPSDVTLRRLIAIHPDFPILRRGSKGKSYRIDLDAAAAFVRSLTQARVLDPMQRRAAIQQLGLEMLARSDQAAGARNG